MIEASAKLKYILSADTLLLIICVAGIVSIHQKAKLPFQISAQDSFNSIVITKDNPYNFSSNDKLISIDGLIIRSNENVEYITDRKNIGEYVSIKVSDFSGERTLDIKLARFYGDFYIISASLTAILFFIIALFVLIKKKRKQSSPYLSLGRRWNRNNNVYNLGKSKYIFPIFKLHSARNISLRICFYTSTIYSFCALFS